VLMVGGIVNVFVGSTAGMMALSVAAIGIFSAYMLYDLKQIIDGGETNYISATLALYLDLFNIFQSLLAFTFFMGIMLSRMIAMVLGFKNGAELIMTAFSGTAGVFFLMASLSTVIKRDLSSMGKWLFVGAMVLMVGSIINVFVGSSAGMMAISMLAIGIFSAYMLYDIKQIIDGGETNYISATLALYMDIMNVFQALLALLGIMGGERD